MTANVLSFALEEYFNEQRRTDRILALAIREVQARLRLDATTEEMKKSADQMAIKA